MEKIGKSGPLVDTDLKFLGYHEVESKKAEDFGLGQTPCRVFEAHIRAGIAEDTHWFIYLLARCSDEDIRHTESVVTGKNSLFEREKCYIVVPKSLFDQDANAIKQLKKANRVYCFDDLMWKKIQEIFSEYIQKQATRIKDLQAKYYVEEPQVKDDPGTTTSLMVSGMLSGRETNESIIVVIKADAGVGKTTLAAQVAAILAKKWEYSKVVPLLLSGQTNWRELSSRAHDVTDLGDILRLALLTDGENFPSLRSEQFIRIMQLGYFAFIFDGFDELTKANGAEFSPQENFEWLANIAKDSNTRIMLTTRSTFWEREVNIPESDHKVLCLKPFDSKNADSYFDKYFLNRGKDNKAAKKAKQFYNQLPKPKLQKPKLQKPQGDNSHGDSFFNLPACAMMIADLVDNDKDASNILMFDKGAQQDFSRKFFLHILGRENIRQRTQVSSAETMHELFENLAVASNEFELDDIASDPVCEIKPENIGRINNHAFIKRIDKSSEKFVFKNDFLPHYLQSSYILRFIVSERNEDFLKEFQRNDYLKNLIKAEADGSGHLSEQMSRMLDKSDMEKVSNLHKACDNHRTLRSLKSFLFHVIAKMVFYRVHNQSRTERGNMILSLLGEESTKHVENLHVQGLLSEVHLNGWKIHNSTFIDFSPEKGKPSEELQFINCDFYGSLTLPDNTKVEGCTGDKTAILTLSEIGSTEITEEETRQHLRTILTRFWLHGRHARPISRGNWEKGNTTAIEQRYDLLNILQEEDVVEKAKHHHLLELKRDATNDVKEFMENDLAQGRVRAVLERMSNKVRAG